MGGIVRSAANMTSVQVRSVFSFAMLGGIMALSVENWVLIGLAHHAVESGEKSDIWFGLIVERTRYNSGLQFWFALVMALVVWGATRFRVRSGDREIDMGKD